jgi:hypothetical protein
MPVVIVGQLKGFNQRLVALHQGVPRGPVHELTRSIQLRPGKIGPVFEKISDPFIMDAFSPLCLDQIAQGNLHQEISERSRVQNASVVDGNKPGHVNSPCLALAPALPMR